MTPGTLPSRRVARAPPLPDRARVSASIVTTLAMVYLLSDKAPASRGAGPRVGLFTGLFTRPAVYRSGWAGARGSTEYGAPAGETFGRPQRLRVIIGRERRHSLRQFDPLHLRAGVNMHVRRQQRGVVQRPDAQEGQLLPAAIVAPDRCAAAWAPGDIVRPSAVRGHAEQSGAAAQHVHSVGLDQRVQHERRTGLALTIAAMTAMHEQWLRSHAIANLAAGAAAFHISLHRRTPFSFDAGIPLGEFRAQTSVSRKAPSSNEL